MANTAEILRNKSESLKNGIIQLNNELKKTNAEAVAMQQTHESVLANLKARHEQELAQLIADNEDMTDLIEKNTAFISAVENLLDT